MKNIIIITSNKLRHDYFRIMFSVDKNINVLKSYVEVEQNKEIKKKLSSFEKTHFVAREKTENDFFSDPISLVKDFSKSKQIQKNLINHPTYIQEIKNLNPDLIITFGCSIIKENFLNEFKNKIINVHLGISPYYLGAGTNFHSLVNSDFQCTGYTFMYMDKGVDTGEIIHQSRAKINHFDNPHQIGNRLIKDMVNDFKIIVKNFDSVKKISPQKTNKKPIICYIKDATPQKTKDLYKNFSQGAVKKFLEKQDALNKEYPIIEQDFMKTS